MSIQKFGENAREGYIIDGVTIVGTTPIHGILEGCDDYNVFGLQLITTSTGAGVWTVEASNDHSTGGANQPINAGEFDDVTSLLNATPTVVAAASNQYRQLTFHGRSLQVTFTPSGGAGKVTAIIFAKSNG